MTYLRNSYPADLRMAHHCSFTVLSSAELAKLEDPATMVGLYIYQVAINEHLRNQRQPRPGGNQRQPLAIDLHFLLTIWAETAMDEHAICGWVMYELNRKPLLDLSSLSKDGGWLPDESVQITPSELSIEDLMRIWDAFTPAYRLSLPYVARVIRIEPQEEAGTLPVVATRFAYADEEMPRD